MDRERHEQIKAVFLTARESPKEVRSTILDERCGDDVELRQEVESLLHHDEVVQQRTSAQPDGAMGIFGATVGERISHFQIQRVVGVGGMGIVYEALQEQPRRTVALKVLRRGIATDSVLRRFKHESEILGRLQHPGIAQIYEAGVHTDGVIQQPYFAMEFIRGGKPITGYAKEQQLSLQQRLELFAHVCDAVHYGHEQGVIHRDLKPGNILINAEGWAKVIDFGVARSTNADMAMTTLQTDVGELIGTLQYMSPEQCTGSPDDLDCRADVYALGVILYELLCDQLPYDLTTISVLEAIRMIREAGPSHLSTVDRALRGDVETIVLKALRKDRDDRYPSAFELAEDIRRYLRAEPIRAHSPTVLYQARVFARRHRSLVVMAAAVFVLAMAAVSAVTFLLTRLQASASRADLVENVIASIQARLCETGSYAEESRALFHVLPESETTAHGGRTLILLPHPSDATLHSMFYLDQAGIVAFKFEPSMAHMPEPVSSRFSLPSHILLRGAIVGDLLPNHPGDEVGVALCDMNYSPCVIQIWNIELTGAPLAELWSIGHVQTMYWNETYGMLLAVAKANALTTFEPRLERWHELSAIKTGAPSVLFAWKPQAGVHVLSPLSGSSHAAEADLEFMLTLVPDYDEALASGITANITSCLSPLSDTLGSVCRLRIAESSRDPSIAQDRQHGYVVSVSMRGKAMGPFLNPSGQTYSEAARVSEPELVALDLPVLRRARDLVCTLDGDPLRPGSATQRLDAVGDLPDAVKETAAAMLRMRFPNAAIEEVRRIVDQSSLRRGEYEEALILAETAVSMRSTDWAAHTALGMAQYRTATTAVQLEQALRTLRYADQSNHRRPARVAAIALTLQRLGRYAEAREELARMENQLIMGGPYVAAGRVFVEEARSVVGGVER